MAQQQQKLQCETFAWRAGTLFRCRRGDVAEGDGEDGTLLVFVGLTK